TLATGDDVLASFSSYGTTSSGLEKPEIVAPGRHIVTAIPGNSALAHEAPAANIVNPGDEGYIRINGTSFSAPQVAGAVALLLQQRPELTPDQVKWVLAHGERPLTDSTAGALDLGLAAAALTAPGKANQGVPYSLWARPGSLTAAFVGALLAADRAAAWDKAAGVWERNAASLCARAKAFVATPKTQKAAVALWSTCASAWEKAAAAWDAGASAWQDAGVVASASDDAERAATDWQRTGDAWKS